MCTVTLCYQEDNNFILTSNRDEAPDRVAAFPDFYTINDTKILMPKDIKSGGSWIGVSEKNRVICLLNGGFNLHKRASYYKHSRGVVVNDLLVANAIEEVVLGYNFNQIEPFTIVIADWNKALCFFELVWDGNNLHFKKLPLTTHIWSSSTLYTESQKQERLQWFTTFKGENKWLPETALLFHKTAGRGNQDYGVVMDRGFVKTTSITQIEKNESSVLMTFESLQDNKTSKIQFEPTSLLNE